MDTIHAVNRSTLPRLVSESLEQRLAVMPAVVITGARQTGKSTLAQKLTSGKRRYFTLDDLDVLEAARNEPEILTEGDEPVTLDEIQREPALLHAVKRSIDKRKRPGHFLLTGSANLLLMGKVSESLAGRASYLTLWPMTRQEQLGGGGCGLWSEILNADEKEWIDLIEMAGREAEDWNGLAMRGGFPTPSVELTGSAERRIWFDGYVRTYLERDLQALSSIEALPDFRRLMRAVCLRLGGLINQSEISRDIGIPQPTIHRYLNLLQTSYLLSRVLPFASNRTKRLMRSPKVYWGDTGLALHVSEEQNPGGAHLENLVLNDLFAWRDAQIERAEIYFWRTQAGAEVDLIIETAKGILPIEIKSGTRPRIDDARHLRTFRQTQKGNVRSGLLVHAGDRTEWIAPDVLAVPWWRII